MMTSGPRGNETQIIDSDTSCLSTWELSNLVCPDRSNQYLNKYFWKKRTEEAAGSWVDLSFLDGRWPTDKNRVWASSTAVLVFVDRNIWSLDVRKEYIHQKPLSGYFESPLFIARGMTTFHGLKCNCHHVRLPSSFFSTKTEFLILLSKLSIYVIFLVS